MSPYHVSRKMFLKDVMICSLGAYGGPEAHYGVFTDQMVIKKKYLTEEEMVELIALTGVLPGPSSTQTITAIGYKMGGPILALLTLLVWALPAIVIMTLLSFLYFFFQSTNLDSSILRYIGPMAVGFIAVAGYRIGKKVIRGPLSAILFVFAMGITYVLRQAWVFPSVLLIGGAVSVLFSKEKHLWHKIELKPVWRYFIAFVVIGLISVGLNLWIQHPLTYLFERFYRYGYLVIGGGQVVIPYMVTDLVDVRQFLTIEEFLTGFGIVQGIPGPMFSFSAYAGGMAARASSPIIQVFGALLSGLGIFLPGTLLIFFVYPIWQQLKTIKGIKVALSGISAVAGGLIAIAAVKLMQASGFSLDNLLVFGLTTLLLLSKKVPAPLIVLLSIVFGVLI